MVKNVWIAKTGVSPKWGRYVVFGWETDMGHFGRTTFSQLNNEGPIRLETETMGKEFARDVLLALIETAEVIE